MRLIQLCDTRIDGPYLGSPLPEGFGAVQRAAAREAFVSTMADAQEWQADAIIITGNLYAADRIRRDTRTWLQEIFENIDGIPVIIAPGSLDAPGPLAPYRLHAWPDNVHVFEDTAWKIYEVPNLPLRVIGRAYHGDAMPPALSIAPPQNTRTIAIAYGDWIAHDVNEWVNKHAIAYFGTGGTAPDTIGDLDAAVCWTPPCLAHDFGSAPGAYLRVELADRSHRVEERVVDTLSFEELTLDVSSFLKPDEAAAFIADQLSSAMGEKAYRIVMRGSLAGGSAVWEHAVLTAAREKALFCCVSDETHAVLPEPTEDDGTVRAAALAQLSTEWRDTEDAGRKSGIARAYTLANAALSARTLSPSEVGA